MKTLAWKQITVAVVIGFLLGSGFGTWQARQAHPQWGQRSPEQKKEWMMGRFIKELKLTDEQKVKVRKILGSSVDQMQALRAEMHPKFQAIRGEMNLEIRTILTPEQLKRFDAMEAKWEVRRNKWHSKRGQASSS